MAKKKQKNCSQCKEKIVIGMELVMNNRTICLGCAVEKGIAQQWQAPISHVLNCEYDVDSCPECYSLGGNDSLINSKTFWITLCTKIWRRHNQHDQRDMQILALMPWGCCVTQLFRNAIRKCVKKPVVASGSQLINLFGIYWRCVTKRGRAGSLVRLFGLKSCD